MLILDTTFIHSTKCLDGPFQPLDRSILGAEERVEAAAIRAGAALLAPRAKRGGAAGDPRVPRHTRTRRRLVQVEDPSSFR